MKLKMVKFPHDICVIMAKISNLFSNFKYYVSVHLSYICSQPVAVGGLPELFYFSRAKLLHKEDKNLACPTTDQFHYEQHSLKYFTKTCTRE